MALIYWNVTNDADTVIGQEGIVFDVSVREDVVRGATPTEFPVETGSTVTDHIQAGQLELILDAMVSNTPIVTTLSDQLPDFNGSPITDVAPLPSGSKQNLALPQPSRSPVVNTQTGLRTIVAGPASQRLVTAGTRFREGGVASAVTLQFDDVVDRVADAYNALHARLEDSTPMTVVIGLARSRRENTPGRAFENMFLTSLDTARDATTGSGQLFQMNFRQIERVSVSLGARQQDPRRSAHRPTQDAGKQATGPTSGAARKGNAVTFESGTLEFDDTLATSITG